MQKKNVIVNFKLFFSHPARIALASDGVSGAQVRLHLQLLLVVLAQLLALFEVQQGQGGLAQTRKLLGLVVAQRTF